jgi:hypothetical protein
MRNETVPMLGTEIEINLDYVAFEDEDGVPRTPMAKARFDTSKRKWIQVPLSMAGLLLFFQTTPKDGQTTARIQSIIPSGRACYVEPA